MFLVRFLLRFDIWSFLSPSIPFARSVPVRLFASGGKYNLLSLTTVQE